MDKAEEQLRGASSLMLQLQQCLAETQQPQAHPLPRTISYGAPSALPREEEGVLQQQAAYPGRGARRSSACSWQTEPRASPTGPPGMPAWDEELVAEPNSASTRGGVNDLQGVRKEAERVPGVIGPGGVGALQPEELDPGSAAHPRLAASLTLPAEVKNISWPLFKALDIGFSWPAPADFRSHDEFVYIPHHLVSDGSRYANKNDFGWEWKAHELRFLF